MPKYETLRAAYPNETALFDAFERSEYDDSNPLDRAETEADKIVRILGSTDLSLRAVLDILRKDFRDALAGTTRTYIDIVGREFGLTRDRAETDYDFANRISFLELEGRIVIGPVEDRNDPFDYGVSCRVEKYYYDPNGSPSPKLAREIA